MLRFVSLLSTDGLPCEAALMDCFFVASKYCLITVPNYNLDLFAQFK